MPHSSISKDSSGRTLRRGFPEFGMSEAGQVDLRQQGIVVIPFMHSVGMDPQRMRPHVHGFFQMFLLRGEARVMHDFTEFRTRGTTLVFMSPGQVHTAQPARGLRGTAVSFTQAFFDGQAAPPSTLLDFPFFFPAEVKPWRAVPATQTPSIVEMFDGLQREFDAALEGAAEILRATLHILLIRIQRLYAVAHPRRKVSRGTQLARRFHLAVEQHFQHLTQVPDYARHLGVTPNHLHDVVREQSGQTAGEIIRQRRLLDAKRLLSHSDLGVSEVGYQLGFEDPSYFTRFFRRSAGCTPMEFREQIREKYQRNAG